MKAVIYARYSSDNQREESLFSLYRKQKDVAELPFRSVLCVMPDVSVPSRAPTEPSRDGSARARRFARWRG